MKQLFISLFLFIGLIHSDSLLAEDSHVKAEVFVEYEQYNPSDSNWVAIRLTMEPKWHVYWKNVGDSGLATSFNFNFPKDVEVKSFLWPTPSSFDTQGLVSYGYHHQATWLLELKGGPKDLEGKINIEWLECADICLPGSESLPLEWNGAPISPEIFKEARQHIPIKTEGFGTMTHLGDHLLWKPSQPQGNTKAWRFFPKEDGWVTYGEDQIWDPKVGLKIPLQKETPKSGSIDGIMTGIGNDGTVMVSAEEQWLISKDSLETSPSDMKVKHLLLMLFFAFLGGLLLNVMPCVLPVLSLKIMQLIDHRDDQLAWKPSLAYTAGVLISFQALALVLILLRQGGSELGWGYQLQDPIVICSLLALFLLLGLNMFGVFEIGVGLVGVDEKVKGKGHLLSSFGSGALATAAATPCSAPFMGAAVGFALTLDTSMNLLVFLFLGLGMAFPFLLVGFIPGALKILPKPGAWMVTLKQGMGFLLMATVAYLFHVLVTLVDDSDRILNVGLALVVISFGAWVYGRSRTWIGKLLTIATMLVAAWLMGPTQKHIEWKPFSEKDIQEELSAGKPIFIDFTASWCTNCKVNERRVLETRQTKELFRRNNVVPFKGDWSRFDPAITQYLAKLGRNSVPVYVVLDPKRPNDPKLLPETLSFSHLEEALLAISKP